MHKSLSFIVIILLAVLVSACNLPVSQENPPPNSSQPDNYFVETYPVDPVFQGLYDFLGGEPMVGPAIAPMIESGDLKTQYFQAAQMVYDPSAPESDRFQLESLGRILGVAESSVKDPGRPGSRFMNGHVILEEFVPMYEQLGGARFVGRPLTEGRHNPDKNRIEQYFENLGFYRLVDEKPGIVHLMAYGAMACPEDCRAQPPSASIPIRKAYLPPPFSTAASNLGLDFTGLTLSGPQPGEDGNMEVIFENLVLMLDSDEEAIGIPEVLKFQLWLPKIFSNIPNVQKNNITFQNWLPVTVKIISGDRLVAQVEVVNPLWFPLVLRSQADRLSGLHLRPIVQMLGIEPESPQPPNNNPMYVFYPTDGELGHHVPVVLDDYLKRYGGVSVVGNPITEVRDLEDSNYRQCFTNLCMDFSFEEGFQARPAPLGLGYKEMYPSGQRFEPKWEAQDSYRLSVYEEKPIVMPGDVEEIMVVVTKDALLQADQVPELTITLPDGTQRAYKLEPTDHLGSTTFMFPLIQAKPATLILYKVCLPLQDGEDLCVEDNYLVWK